MNYKRHQGCITDASLRRNDTKGIFIILLHLLNLAAALCFFPSNLHSASSQELNKNANPLPPTTALPLTEKNLLHFQRKHVLEPGQHVIAHKHNVPVNCGSVALFVIHLCDHKMIKTIIIKIVSGRLVVHLTLNCKLLEQPKQTFKPARSMNHASLAGLGLVPGAS